MKRILYAFLIAIVGIALSWHYLRPGEWTSNSGSGRQVIAHVLDVRNDVNKQDDGRLLWSPIRKGDEIFLGDKIKTSGLSSTVIQFIESSSKLEIEENTMIVMSQREKKLTLNMLEGRVFIQQAEGSSDQSVDLLSGGKLVDIQGNTSVSVSKDGDSKVESFALGQNLFSDLTPEYSQEILSVKNETLIKWKAVSRTEEVEVFIGESPLLLKKVEGLKADLSSGKLEVPMKPGINYWQLVAKEMKSPLMKLSLIRPLSPTPLYPAENELIKIGERPFDFKWTKGNSDGAVQVEVSKNASFTQVIFSEKVLDQTFFSPPTVLTEGQYYWRVKSQFGQSDFVESKTIPFTVHLGSNFLSPLPVFPEDDAVFYFGRNPSNVIKFEWRKQNNVTGYLLKIQGDNFSRNTPLTENTTTVNLNRVGKYTWEVVSEGQDGKQSVLPAKRSFEVRESGVIEWSMNQKSFLYLDSLPIIILRWEKKVPGVSVLKISTSADMKDAESFQVQGRDFPYRPMNKGIYFAKVSTLGERGEIAAESDLFEFSIDEAPLPPPPLLTGEPKEIKTTTEGELRTQIKNGKPAWLTIVSLTDAAGRVVDERRFSDDKLSFSGLMPGKYALQAKFQDEYRRSGELSERVTIIVPEKSTIAAPKVKGIKVR
jgi:hypothetical protein